MFEPSPASRSDMKSGTLYAISGKQDWIYYGQVTPDKRVGFFKRRDRILVRPEDVLIEPIMAVVGVSYPSIGRALRSGAWKKLGRYAVPDALRASWPLVQWPVGTLIVGVSRDGVDYETTVDDPEIQQMEIIASWDAEYHIPERLTADFGAEEAAWHVGGPIWRERRIKEELAKRHPDQP